MNINYNYNENITSEYCIDTRTGEITYATIEREKVYRDLANALIWKKLERRTSITRITRENRYNGFLRISVYCNNGYKYIFIVEA